MNMLVALILIGSDLLLAAVVVACWFHFCKWQQQSLPPSSSMTMEEDNVMVVTCQENDHHHDEGNSLGLEKDNDSQANDEENGSRATSGTSSTVWEEDLSIHRCHKDFQGNLTHACAASKNDKQAHTIRRMATIHLVLALGFLVKMTSCHLEHCLVGPRGAFKVHCLLSVDAI